MNNNGRFRYTGQVWLPELGLYYYKAWMYSPTIGRFMQTDPIGYADGMNMYAYVGNDPVNGVDPTGLAACTDKDGTPIICAIGRREIYYVKRAGLKIPHPQLGVIGVGVHAGGGLRVEVRVRKTSQNDVCSQGVPNPEGVLVSPNQARKQIRQERLKDFNNALNAPFHPNREPYLNALGAGLGRTINRLAPGGRFDTNPGNIVYGAASNEAGLHVLLAQAAAHGLEILEQAGLKESNDPNFFDTPEAQAQIVRGARCPG